MMKEIKIGVCISEAKYQNYPAWIRLAGNQYTVVELSFEKQNAAELENCHALLLTGGIDIDPIFYQPELKEYPLQPKAFNRQRDEFEMGLFRMALNKAMPVLGICRGLQLINTTLGGTLIPDIETIGKPNHRSRNGIDHIHEVIIEPNSKLAAITGCSAGIVNSSHHQSVLEIAPALSINAYSKDGIVESLAWKEAALHQSPMLAVQWHPERMNEKNNNPLSKKILDWFLYEASKYHV
jgi:putative glutamine amidotransferase